MDVSGYEWNLDLEEWYTKKEEEEDKKNWLLYDGREKENEE